MMQVGKGGLAPLELPDAQLYADQCNVQNHQRSTFSGKNSSLINRSKEGRFTPAGDG